MQNGTVFKSVWPMAGSSPIEAHEAHVEVHIEVHGAQRSDSFRLPNSGFQNTGPNASRVESDYRRRNCAGTINRFPGEEPFSPVELPLAAKDQLTVFPSLDNFRTPLPGGIALRVQGHYELIVPRLIRSTRFSDSRT
ncbi:hypothetical protein ABEX25_20100 [Paenibacillus thiaminolyticus]|uniref:hypothetical protein n=1 Tax=Paenibacillus thiaminolyticus TaxID=49283 RepID=UPI003D2E5E26